jgi:hypothetical protein
MFRAAAGPARCRKSSPSQYAMVQSRAVIVDPATKKIVSIITE